ncbi:MAG: iron-sulfur cluster assembly protein [Candidatus Dormiibacterota bacterium]
MSPSILQRIDLAAVRAAAGSVSDPEIRRSLADMELLDAVEHVGGGEVLVRYHLTSPLCPSPFAVQIGREVRSRVEAVRGVKRCRVDIQDHFIAAEIAEVVNEDSSGAGAAIGQVVAALAGRREFALLSQPSVARLVRLLARRCRSPEPVIRAAVSTLDRFRLEAASGRLSPFLAAARHDPMAAEDRFRQWVTRDPAVTDTQAAALAFGPKLWLRANGVPVPWRPLGGAPAETRNAAHGDRPQALDKAARPLLLALAGSGMSADELLTRRVGDAGSMDEDGGMQPDLDAEPLAVRYQAEGGTPRLAFLSYEARAAVLTALSDRDGAGHDPSARLIGGPPAAALLERARTRHEQLIAAGNDVNVATCRATGEFFRAWGLPGSRFTQQGPTLEGLR